MFEQVRRIDREIDQDECIEVIKKNNVGILSLNNTAGHPYGVPLNYMFWDGALYFHCAKEGKKLNLISSDDRACFVIIGKNEVVPNELTTYYQSVIIFGNIEKITDDGTKNDILLRFGEYFGCDSEMNKRYVEKKTAACDVLKFEIAHISGKMKK